MRFFENRKMSLMPTETSTTEIAAVDTNSTAPTVTVVNVADNFGTFHGKPNAIVRPVRRYESIDEMFQPLENGQQLNEHQAPTAVQIASKKIQHEIDIFSKELDLKLKHLQKDKRISSKNVK